MVLKLMRLSKRARPKRRAMKCIVKLSETERYALQKMSVNDRHRAIRLRAAGRLLGNGLSIGNRPNSIGVISSAGPGKRPTTKFAICPAHATPDF
jgi:hypothetical protein